MTISCDLVIRGGTIVDGTGREPFAGDVAIRGDRIVGVGDVACRGAEEIDAAGRIVTPGFVDIHTHYDGQAIWSDRLSPSSSHGVTTAVLGNCGVGFAPCRPADHERLIRVMEGVEDIPGVVMAEGLTWDWETFPEYLAALEARPRDIDVGAFLPHSPLRVYVMGERGAKREPATAEDLERMRAIAREAIEAGALGVSSSRLFIHRTKAGELIPTYDASLDEIEAIAGGMRDVGRGIVQIVLDAPYADWNDEVSKLLAIVERCGRPATFTVGTANEGPRTWEKPLERIAAANARGAQISAQVLPRPIGLLSGFELSLNPFTLCPSWAPLAQLPLETRLERLRDPAVRAALVSERPGEANALAIYSRNWDWMFPLGDPPDYAPPREASIGARARAEGRTPEDVAFDHLMTRDGRGMLYNTLGNFYEGRLDALREMLLRPEAVVGLGDGGAHYGAICDASYPTFMLMYWARDRAGPGLTLPHVVRALSSDPARVVGLDDRGRLAAGCKADVNVIDLERLQLHAPEIVHDLPGGGRRLDQRATGYEATIVSGRVIRRGDAPTGERPGRVVRGARPMP